MQEMPDIYYQALRSRDPRFDGVFFVGVSSTGIYCRPICPSKLPKRENCTFYITAAAAERAGFRPCLRCRPELAPGNSRIDAVSRTAALIASRIEDGALPEIGVSGLAGELGISSRHLRRITESEFGVSPVELAQTHRLLTAKRLLTDTDLTVGEIAFAGGFNSVRRFNALFKERYRLNPTSMRRSREGRAAASELVCEVAFRPPLDWAALLDFLRVRATPGVEFVDTERYRRTVSLGKHRGWLEASIAKGRPVVIIRVASSLAPCLLHVTARVKRLLDLNADPVLIASDLGCLAEAHPGMRVPGAFDGYEIAVRAVLGQQVSVKAATTLAGRFAAEFGRSIATPFSEMNLLFPEPESVAKANASGVAALGMPGGRAQAIYALSKAVADGELSLEPGGDLEAKLLALKALPGIGEWTAQYVGMRAFRQTDAFPNSDLAILKALRTVDPSRALEQAEQWRPWRAYAAMHLWGSVARGQEILR